MRTYTKNTLMKSIIIVGIITFSLIAVIVGFLIGVPAQANTSIDENTPSSTVSNTSITFILPMKNATIVKDYSAKELQYNDTLEQWEIHKAIDFKSDTSNEVLAVYNGTISNIYTNYLEGTVIVIDHGNGLKSIYKSLNNELTLKVGDTVKQGDVIATVSDTMSRELNTGAHLHFEVFKDELAVDPNDYLETSSK